jgi:hypothetical protein
MTRNYEAGIARGSLGLTAEDAYQQDMLEDALRRSGDPRQQAMAEVLRRTFEREAGANQQPVEMQAGRDYNPRADH